MLILIKLQHGNQKDNSLNPGIYHINNTKIWVKFDGSCLKHKKVTFTQKQVANIYIAYEINLWQFNFGEDFALGNSSFGDAKLTRNVDPGKYKYSGYGAGLDAPGSFWLSDGSGFGKNVIFDANMNSLVHIDKKKKDILILGNGP